MLQMAFSTWCRRAAKLMAPPGLHGVQRSGVQRPRTASAQASGGKE